MATVTVVNSVATMSNLHLEGAILVTNVVSATAFPINTTGTYQLMTELLNNISVIKDTIKIAEEQLFQDLAADVAGTITVTAPVQIAAFESATGTFNDRGGLTGITNTKPSLLDDGTNFYSEDALFQFFSQISYEIMKFRFDLATGNNNGMGAGHPGEFALIISAAA